MSFGRPVIATSLNLAGEESLTNLDNLSEYLKNGVDLIIDAGQTKIGSASTIIMVKDNEIEVLREGPIKF